MPHDIAPMLAASVKEPFDDPDWIFEIKHDGYRAIAEIERGVSGSTPATACLSTGSSRGQLKCCPQSGRQPYSTGSWSSWMSRGDRSFSYCRIMPAPAADRSFTSCSTFCTGMARICAPGRWSRARRFCTACCRSRRKSGTAIMWSSRARPSSNWPAGTGWRG